MADTVREIERKYEATDATPLPDLTALDRVAAVVERGVAELDATYYDTADQKLAADGITLRRRTGGDDAGWHLKLPVALGIRDEVRMPLAPGAPPTDAPPPQLTALVRSRTLGHELVPLIRLRTRRTARLLQAADGTPLAELAQDAVRAARADGSGEEARWHEIEVELTGEGDAALLDAVGRELTAAGVRPAAAPSKLARALTETGLAGGSPHPRHGRRPRTAGDAVLRYVDEQIRAVAALDPAVRRDLPDSVHQMRVATRRLRSAFRSYTAVLDRSATRPLGLELQWLAAELGIDRDREVLTARLWSALAQVPRPLRFGPVSARLRLWSERRRLGSRREVLAVLDGDRYLELLRALEALRADPPLRRAAALPAPEVLVKAVLKDYARLADRVETALETPAGRARDEALHSARKAAKRLRYAAEAARPVLGGPAKKFARRTKRVQQVLGDHQDSVVARTALRELATQAHLAGEPAFTFGLLYGREEALAAERERELPTVWAKAVPPGKW
ncbi:CYTH and CHAD domain-containing protein [Streptomyces gilvosporeus]|uniref:Metal-binding protein n=1 Tax=Streptomyces gilvosporeus TaxID=553510 RepID=A0A1V0TRB9_9ACTN|nr:CYTH and CHAD domain-containing protein [Streptomyces gilvosporeus]ARF55318.1 metal-binding protein [Streptomyces gilvosporeus]